ncbi:uncharacterized protein [Hetaerina americana]|uniref:uncharacterized protein n=1 Tax=Hetaerina americana TaxID=62018 RepID=UPI003A7F310E
MDLCLQERHHSVSKDENSSWKNSVCEPNTLRKFGMKRPVAAIAPAIENYHQEKGDDQSKDSTPKKACPFIPKKPSSLSKKFFTHSNSWMQLEKELSDLLRKDLPKP